MTGRERYLQVHGMSAVRTFLEKDAHHMRALGGVDGLAVASSARVRVQPLRGLRAGDEQAMHEPSSTLCELLCSLGDVADRPCKVVERERAARGLDRGRGTRDVHGGGSDDDTAGLVVLGFDGVEHSVALEHRVLADAAPLEYVHLWLAFRILGI